MYIWSCVYNEAIHIRYDVILTLNLENSICKDDPAIDQKLKQLFISCGETFQADLLREMDRKGRLLTNDEKCQLINKLDQCIATQTNVVCGPEMATFMEKIWKIASKDSFGVPGCDANHQQKREYHLIIIIIIIIRCRAWSRH
ncbi:hypothetical protein ElyMa_002689000 [Elysia marginata]|uniref:Uncharacterized protein n=1 Tax=Elysia marginata TaxID=1093978 RepID=A0AAV4HBS5_9GAST|nr:hypothetical protein ElyMa_002689000 [Elysia marginata]